MEFLLFLKFHGRIFNRKKMKKLVLIISLIFVCSTQGQELVNIYAPLLPSKLLESASQRKQVEINLEFNAGIHPELLYYYINSLNNIYRKNISDPEKSGSNLYLTKKYDFIKARDKWFERQRDILRKITDSSLELNKMLSFFHTDQVNIVDDVRSEDNITDELNYKSYIISLYFLREYKPFDRQINYDDLVRQLIRKKISSLEISAKQSSIPDEEFIKFIKENNSFWYLIGEKFRNEFNLRTDFETADLIYERYHSDFEVTTEFYVAAGITFLNSAFYQNETFIFKDKPLPTFAEPKEILFPVQLKQSRFINLGVGCQFNFYSKLPVFSVADIYFSYIHYEQEYTDTEEFNDVYDFKYNVISGDESEFYKYTSNGLKNKNSQMFSLSITGPVYFLNEIFSLEIGGAAYYYSYSMEYEMIKRDNYRNGPDITVKSEEIFNKKISSNDLIISPQLGVKINFTRSLQLKFNTSYFDSGLIIQTLLAYKI